MGQITSGGGDIPVNGIVYGGTVGGGSPNEVLYISPGGNLTSDPLYLRDASEGTFSVQGVVSTGYNSSVRVGLVPIAGFPVVGSMLVHQNLGATRTAFVYAADESGIGEEAVTAAMGWYDSNSGIDIAVFCNSRGAQIQYNDTNAGTTAELSVEAGGVISKSADNTSGTYSFKSNNQAQTLWSVRGDGLVSTKDYSFPTADGSANQLISTNGAGQWSYTNLPTGGTGFTEDGSNNLYAGTGTLASLASGQENFSAGVGAASNITDGLANIIIGNAAGLGITTGNINVVIGFQADVNKADGHDNTLVGTAATSSHNNCTLLGSGATGSGDNAIAIGLNVNAGANEIKIGNLNLTPQIFATGAGHTVDQLIAALQTTGLFTQT